MEIICVDKQTFEELRVRFCDFEERMTRVCRPAEDLGLKNWLDNQEVCDVLRINKNVIISDFSSHASMVMRLWRCSILPLAAR